MTIEPSSQRGARAGREPGRASTTRPSEPMGGAAPGRAGRVRRGVAAAFATMLLGPGVPGGVAAAPPVVRQDEAVLEDQIAVEVLGRDVYGFDALGGGRNHLRLELDEWVLAQGQRGLVAFVMTNRRILALASGAGPWRELSLRVRESGGASSWIAPRVLVVATAQRILGFDASSATWLQIDVGPNETVTHVELGASTAIVVTDRQAYGLSPDAGGFFATRLRLHEELEQVTASATLGQVRTSQRILVFRSPSGSWSIEKRPID